MNFLLGMLMIIYSGELNYSDTRSDCRMCKWLAMKASERTNPPPQTLQ